MNQTGATTTLQLEKIPFEGLNTRKYANNAYDAAPTSLIKRSDCSLRVSEAIPVISSENWVRVLLLSLSAPKTKSLATWPGYMAWLHGLATQ